MASSDSSVSNLYLHNLQDKIKLVRRVIKGKDGKPQETQTYISNQLSNPNTNLMFMLGDADAGRLCKVVKKPGQFEDRAESSFTMLVGLQGEDAAGARLLQESVVNGMKELGIINASISTHPDVIKLIMSPLIYEREDGDVAMAMNITDDTQFFLKVTKGKHAGKFMTITRDQVRNGDGVVVVIRCDRHRDKPKHRFTRYAQKVFVIERSDDKKDLTIIGSSGKTVDIIDYDPELEEEEEAAAGGAVAAAGGAGAVAVAVAAAGGAAAGGAGAVAVPADNNDDDDDEFQQALKRARKEV
jgi:hypothetical protein